MLKISSQFQALLFQKLMASVFKIILIYRIIYHTKTVQLHSTELTILTQSGKFQWKEASLTMNLYTDFMLLSEFFLRQPNLLVFCFSRLPRFPFPLQLLQLHLLPYALNPGQSLLLQDHSPCY